MAGPPGRRRALTQVGGDAEIRGDRSVGRWLAYALDVEPHVDRWTHGFHTYPARMHPDTAARLLEGLDPGARVLDPFCGGGTVLVEAMVRGLGAGGVDLSPLAVALSRVKTWRASEAELVALVQEATDVAARSTARVRGRVPARAPLGREDARWYAPHVLIEMAGLPTRSGALPRARSGRRSRSRFRRLW
jgi:hypothetical protein